MQSTRRGFLAGAAGMAATAGIAAAGIAQAEGATRFVDTVEWNAVYDVVVMGYGAAAASAAITAADDGAKVLMLEKAPRGREGGDSILSGQVVMGCDPEHINDLKTYFISMCDTYQDWDEECFQAMAEGCAQNFDWLVSLGADPDVLRQDYDPEKKNTSFRYKGSGYIWNENPQLEGAGYSIAWVVKADAFKGTFYNLLKDNVEARADQITVWYSAPAKHLIQDPATKTIVGVQALKDGKLVNILAKNGVVMALGGYEANQKMMGSFLQRPFVSVKAGVFNEGDGVKMAIEAGADLWHMSNSAGFTWAYWDEGMPTSLQFSVAKGILVGPGGTRFINETGSNRHGRIDIGGRWIQTPYPNPTYFIEDADSLAAAKLNPGWSDGNVEEVEKGWIKKADTIEELAEAIGVPVANLVATVDKYNAAYDAGIDADYARPFAKIVPIKTPPFYYCQVYQSMYNTQGGARRNAKAQIVDTEGQPIPHLYSAGDFGAIWPDMYNGSGNLGECAVFGRIAGHGAAAPKDDYDVENVAVNDLGIVDEPYVYPCDENEYIGKTRSKGGDLVVKCEIVDGELKEIYVVQCNDTPRWCDRAMALVPPAIIAAQSTEVDSIAGCTVTSEALKTAVAQAWEQAKK